MENDNCENKHNNNLIFVLCGPSGVGKTSLKISILEMNPDIKLCLSVTTRPEKKTPYSIEEYHYISDAEYKRLHRNGELITRKRRQFGFYYGIKRSEIIDILEKKQHVLVETTLWGITQLKKSFNNVISIFIAPPSLEELERRLKRRERENDGEIALRLDLAEQILTSFKRDMVDYRLINEDLLVSAYFVNTIIAQEKLKLNSKHK